MRSSYGPYLSVIAILGFCIISLHYFSVNKSSFRPNDCDTGVGCIETYMKVNKFKRAEMIELIQDEYLFPPLSTSVADNLDMTNYYPPWKELMQWDNIQESLIDFFQDQPAGTFIEIGAVDGLFLSQTFYLEKKLNWTGLLIEPDPRSFSRMLKNKRNATKVPLCIKDSYPSVQKFWLRRMEKNLPEHFQQVLLARSILAEEMMDGDEERGGYILAPCVPLSVVIAAAKLKVIDFLTIATGGEEDHSKIDEVLHRKSMNVKTLLIHFPASAQAVRPMTPITGYIIDALRSHVLYKFYIKEKYCKLQSKTECVKIDHFKYREACLKYTCFGNIPVSVVDTKSQENSTSINKKGTTNS